MSITISRSYKYVDYNVSAPNNRGYLTIDTSSWIDYPWMFYELPALKFEIYTESGGELLKYKNFTREIRTYNPVYSPLGVLNVTIDIRNVPEEFILRITPIFDNDAISARNMLIENGIEDGEIWGKDQDIPTQSFDLDLEFIECSGEYIPPVPPTHEETITGVPPITFDGSTGDPLVSWTILGNGQQTGTPSPQNIIMPTFCGVRTGNLWSEDYTGISQTIKYVPIYVGNGDVTISTTCGRSGTGAGAAAVLFLLSGSVSTGASTDGNGVWNGNDRTVSTVDGYVTVAFRAYITANPADAETMVNLGSTALPYEPFGWAEKITCGGENLWNYMIEQGGWLAAAGTIPTKTEPGDSIHTIRCRVADIIPIPRRTMSLTCQSGIKINFVWINANGVSLGGSGWQQNGSTVTAPENATSMTFILAKVDDSTCSPNDFQNIMLTPSSTLPVYLGEVPTVRRIKKLVLDGTEAWYFNDANHVFYMLVSDAMTIENYISSMCTHYKAVQNKNVYANMNDGECCIRGNDRYLWIRDNSIADANGFKTFLAAQYANGTPVTVWYVLATPTTDIINEPLCKIGDYADELQSENAGVSIPTAKGANTLMVGGDLQPSEMTITYIKEE